MCTVVIFRRPADSWPVILGANRDEMLQRPWQSPARHWADRPEIVAGLDQLAGGTWMGLNDTGVMACILNRPGSLGPAPGKRSRGELVLEALDHSDAADAAQALRGINPKAYRPFNMIIADNRDAWWLTLTENSDAPRLEPIPEGFSMFTAHDRNDLSDKRIATYLPRFREANVPDPEQGHWKSWVNLLGSVESNGQPYDAMNFRTETGFGTSSSSLLALPSIASVAAGKRPIWLFAPGPLDSAAFTPVDI